MKPVLHDIWTSGIKIDSQLTPDIILDIDSATTLPIESAIPMESIEFGDA